MKKNIAAICITVSVACLLAWWAARDNTPELPSSQRADTADSVPAGSGKSASQVKSDERLISALADKLASRTYTSSAAESASPERADSDRQVSRRPRVIVTGRDRATRDEIRIPRAGDGMVKSLPDKLMQQRAAHGSASTYESMQQMRATRSIVVVGSRSR